MKNIPITLTLPEEVVRDLRLYISRRGMSHFVAKVVEEALKWEKERLSREFYEASHDEERNQEIALWDALSDEGLDEENEFKNPS